MKIFNVFRRRKNETESTSNFGSNMVQIIPLSQLGVHSLVGDVWGNLQKTDLEEIKSAMNIAEVAEYVNFVCDMIAPLQIRLYTTTAQGVVEVKGDPRVMALNVGTDNSNMDGYQLKKALVRDYLWFGEGYAYINEVGGNFSGLYYVPSTMVSARVNKRYNTLANRSYTLLLNPMFPFRDGEQQSGEFDARKFLRFLRHSTNGVEGVGIAFEYSKLLNIMSNELKGLNDAVRNPGLRLVAAKLMHPIARDQQEAQQKKIEQALSDAQMGKAAVLDHDIELLYLDDPDIYKTLFDRSAELHQRLRRLFKLDSSFEDRVTESVLPVVKAFEAMLNFSLLSYDDKKNYFFEFDTDELFNVHPQKRYDRYKIAIDAGVKTRNEIRNAEKIGSKEGLDYINSSLRDVWLDNKKVIVPNTGKVIDLTAGKVIDLTTEKEMDNERSKNPLVDK